MQFSMNDVQKKSVEGGHDEAWVHIPTGLYALPKDGNDSTLIMRNITALMNLKDSVGKIDIDAV